MNSGCWSTSQFELPPFVVQRSPANRAIDPICGTSAHPPERTGPWGPASALEVRDAPIDLPGRLLPPRVLGRCLGTCRTSASSDRTNQATLPASVRESTPEGISRDALNRADRPSESAGRGRPELRSRGFRPAGAVAAGADSLRSLLDASGPPRKSPCEDLVTNGCTSADQTYRTESREAAVARATVATGPKTCVGRDS